MKAIVQTEYGSPDVLRLAEVDLPAQPENMPDHSVLVRVHATAVHAGDWHLMRGSPFLLRLIYGGLRQPRFKILGCDVAGQVEAVGKAVTQFQVGDRVFGDLSESGFGTFAEYVCAPETAFALKPVNTTFEEAAIVPVSALAALQGLRDVGRIQAGQRVLIKGASGGVGSFAVQIAKAYGAEVTAVCSSSKADRVRSNGADYIIDTAQAPAALQRQHYDLILDAAAYYSVFKDLPALKPQGTYVLVGGSMPRLFLVMLLGSVISRISRRQVMFLASKPNSADLTVLKDLIEAGKIRPCLDRCYPLSEVPTAMEAIEKRQVQGKIAIRV
jgi:NADPH:quinone reductase-like Zn-dependent oxidoreductase